MNTDREIHRRQMHETSWHPPASLQRHGLRWVYIPLIAFAIFAAGPSLLAPIEYIVNSAVDLSRFIGPLQRPPALLTLLLEPLVLTIALWPFLALYSITRRKLIEQPGEWRSIRLAMVGATFAMSVPSIVLLIGAPQEMMSSAPDAGQGLGILTFFFMVAASDTRCHWLADRSWHRPDAAYVTACQWLLHPSPGSAAFGALYDERSS